MEHPGELLDVKVLEILSKLMMYGSMQSKLEGCLIGHPVKLNAGLALFTVFS